jgi:hypothetical protein
MLASFNSHEFSKLLFNATIEQMTLQAAFRVNLQYAVPEQKIYQLTTVREGSIQLAGIYKFLFNATFEQMTLQAAFRVSLHYAVPEQKLYQLTTVREGFIQLAGI